MDGFLLVDKPAGWTSHDVVAKIRNILKKENGQKVKVGHTGTLDPFATGLLIIVVGSYCKRAGDFSKLDKTYEAELVLGSTSTTGDPEGQITPLRVVPLKMPAEEQMKTVLNSFEGGIQQTPHKFSAIKVDGQRAYKLARAGKEVKLEPRKVRVERIELREYSYPKLKIVAEVSSGTYIRSLAEDIGQKLRTGAYLSALRRTEIGKFNVEDAMKAEGLTATNICKNIIKA